MRYYFKHFMHTISMPTNLFQILKFYKFLKFIQHIGLTDLKYFINRPAGAQRDILLTFSKTLINKLVKNQKIAASYRLMIDDMTDVSTKVQMICRRQIFYLLSICLKLCKC